MTRDFAEEWLNKLKDYWFNKDIKKAVSLFTKTSFYQETPFMKPYTTIKEINEEWQHNEYSPGQDLDCPDGQSTLFESGVSIICSLTTAH